MIEFTDRAPAVEVEEAEYLRLLGYPRGFVPEGRGGELACWAREWYGRNGRPWLCVREARQFGMDGGRIQIEGAEFESQRLRRTLTRAEAHSVVIAAVSAGADLEEEARRLWDAERPDEYFFLETFGSAVVERLTTVAGALLCAEAESQAMAVLPHYSPGYPEWDIAQQGALLELMRRRGHLPGAVEVLESGALRPKKSLLAVFGLTRHMESRRHLSELVPCENCSFAPCQYRRTPYVERGARYAVNSRALRKWAAERLILRAADDGGVHARFRYDGTTCTNMGRPLTFHYDVHLGPREQGFPIRAEQCSPAPGDEGYKCMCEYIRDRDKLMAGMAAEKPLMGQPLSAALAWRPAASAAGCYCEAESRQHKWALVLETIHYALTQTEMGNRL